MKAKSKVYKVDVLMPTSSQYNVLHHFARKLFAALMRAGMDCRLLEGDDRWAVSYRSPPDFTIGFNGALKMEDNSLFCDLIKVPHVACLVDPPYRFYEITKSPHVIITCDDQLCCSLLQEDGFTRTAFMPHAVEVELAPDPKKKRIYDVVFLATCIDSENRRKQWRKKFSSPIWHLMEDAAAAALGDEETSFMSLLKTRLSPWEHQNVYEEVEMYIKGKDRLDLLEAFEENHVHVFGNSVDQADWNSLLKKKAHITVHPAVGYEEAIAIMQQSKVVLNSSIKNKLGAHERIFTAAACGAAVVTNGNPYMRKQFVHDKEILFYQRNDMPALNASVHTLLNDEQKRENLASAGRQRVMQHHTWDCRVQELLIFLETQRNR